MPSVKTTDAVAGSSLAGDPRRPAAPSVVLVSRRRSLADGIRLDLVDRDIAVIAVLDPPGSSVTLSQEDADVVIVDARVWETNIDGLRDQLFSSRTGIISLGVDDDETERVLALELGADDSVSSRCGGRELAARVRSLQARLSKDRDSDRNSTLSASTSGWRFDEVARRVSSPTGAAGYLSGRVSELLTLFLRNPNRILAPEDLSNLSRTTGETITRTQDWRTWVCRLRDALQALDPEVSLIKTVRGRGYVFDFEAWARGKDPAKAAPIAVV